MQVGDLIRIIDVPRGHNLDSLVGQVGFIMPTPTFPETWEHYINVFVENRRQCMLRSHIELIQRVDNAV
jgi:hypothetical protein